MMKLKLFILDKTKKLGLSNKNLSIIQFQDLLNQEYKEVQVEEEKVRIYKTLCPKKANRHRRLLAKELLDLIQICIAGLVMLSREGIDIEQMVKEHNQKLITEREWEPSHRIDIDIQEEIVR